MSQYQPTGEEQDIINALEAFRGAIKNWKRSPKPEEREQLRSLINRNIEKVREIIYLAGCFHTFTVSPPPAVGGLIMPNVDPFKYIFEDVYGQSMNSTIFDMIDQTIGVIERGKYQERKDRLKKATGSLGPTAGKKVFLVHGHDEAARESTARFLEKLGLEPIILHEQPNAGRTIIEKVEQHGAVAFAVVLLTPDDVGGVRGSEAALKPRARQNVILELGYFLGRLGRTHVAALLKGEIEKPSDYDGVVYIPIDSTGAWKLLLAKELKAAGLDVDLNDVM